MFRLANFSLPFSLLSSLASRLSAPYRALRAYLDRWMFQLGGETTTSVVLVQRRIFILPSRHGLLFVGALALMLSGSINYNLNLGFILTFLLAALGVNAILHTFRNLARLKISAGRAPPVFAGDTARFALVIDNPTTLERYSIGIAREARDLLYTDAPALQSTTAGVPVPAPQRGVLRPGRLTLFTEFPLGLCHAWAYAELDMQCIVYPRPESGRVPLPPASADDATGSHPAAPGRRISPGCAPIIPAIRRGILRGKPPRAVNRCSPSNSAAAPRVNSGSTGNPPPQRWASRRGSRGSRAGSSTRMPRV